MTHRDPVTALAAGQLVTMVDETAREGGAELWLAAELAEATEFARLVRYTSGFVTVAMPAMRCAALGLPAMCGAYASWTERRPVQAVTCDAAEGISTGISAADRALTARLLAHPDSSQDDFCRPGHLVPLRVRGGLTDITSSGSGALELCAIAGLRAAMVRCELVLDDGALARAGDGIEIAATLGTPVVRLRELTGAIPLGALSA